MVRRRWTAGAAVLAAVALLGIPLGALWWGISSRPEVTVADGGGVLPYPATEASFGVQGRYALLAAGAGMLTGYCSYLAQYRLARRAAERPGAAGPVPDLRMICLVGLTAGSIAGALLLWGTGVLLDGDAFERALAAAEPGDVISDRIRLDALGALVVWPFVAVLQYGLFDAVSIWRRDLPTDGVAAPPPAPERPAVPAGTPAGPGATGGAPDRSLGPAAEAGAERPS
ncbi:hypothetical protein [Nocardiopsis composta]|uniref:Nitrogen fixation-related uncharacterized protein n=1 Tax=Nocardiopsis composta TaxID=157465 RepID=A0A7W8QTC1_9ACTN|nr:hypothetical protein [Nocardiopsis composta]MBB5435824.1 nitrogen fixation-related uncharacterized protein [Nocardiopsis composta]